MSDKPKCPYCGNAIIAIGNFMDDRYHWECPNENCATWRVDYKTTCEALAACKLLPVYEHAGDAVDLLHDCLNLIMNGDDMCSNEEYELTADTEDKIKALLSKMDAK